MRPGRSCRAPGRVGRRRCRVNVFDTALLAFLQGEDGAACTGEALTDGGACGAANWSESLGHRGTDQADPLTGRVRRGAPRLVRPPGRRRPGHRRRRWPPRRARQGGRPRERQARRQAGQRHRDQHVALGVVGGQHRRDQHRDRGEPGVQARPAPLPAVAAPRAAAAAHDPAEPEASAPPRAACPAGRRRAGRTPASRRTAGPPGWRSRRRRRRWSEATVWPGTRTAPGEIQCSVA